MKKVYILDESISSKRNGIGTYTRQLVRILKPVAEVCVVSFNSESKELAVVYRDGIRQIMFPPFPTGNYTSNGDIISVAFKIYIGDDSNNLIIASHSPCSDFLAMIREYLPLSKIIFVIHDFGWTMECAGNRDKYTRIIKAGKRKNIKNRYSFLIDRYDEEKRIYGLSDKIVCLCHESFCLLRDLYGVDEKKLSLISNGLPQSKKGDRATVRKDFFIDNDEKVLLFSGRLVSAKGIDVLFSAFEKVLLQNPKARLVLAGSLNSHVEKLLASYPHAVSRITVTGFLPKELLQKWYAIADIGVIPSCYEQCSYTGIEMMMNGIPVVTTDGYGLSDMFKSGENASVVKLNGCKCPKKTAEDLANAIVSLLDSEELCEYLGKKAYETYKNRYQLKHMRMGYVKLINEL